MFPAQMKIPLARTTYHNSRALQGLRAKVTPYNNSPEKTNPAQPYQTDYIPNQLAEDQRPVRFHCITMTPRGDFLGLQLSVTAWLHLVTELRY